MLNWFRKLCISGYAELMSLLNKLLRKETKYAWTQEHQDYLDMLKKRLVNLAVLAFPRFDIPFQIAVDCS